MIPPEIEAWAEAWRETFPPHQCPFNWGVFHLVVCSLPLWHYVPLTPLRGAAYEWPREVK